MGKTLEFDISVIQDINRELGWLKDRLADAKDMARFYAGTPHNLETDCYDRGPAKRFLKSLETRPKLEPTDA